MESAHLPQADGSRMQVPGALQPFARRKTLPRSGVRLFYYDAGRADSPAMILVHGLGDESDTWRRVIPSLAGSFRVVAPDLPGFGRSALPRHHRAHRARCGFGLTPRFLADVLLELVGSLGIASATWVGSSLGASLAQVAALRSPQSVSRLVLVDGGVTARAPLRGALLAMLIPGVGEGRYRRLAHDIDAAYESLRPYYRDLDGLPAAERAFLRERVKDRVTSVTQRKAYFSMFRSYFVWSLLAGRRAMRQLQGQTGKTLYVWGAEDRIVPADGENALRLRRLSARVVTIQGAGHLPHQESPEEFLRVLRT